MEKEFNLSEKREMMELVNSIPKQRGYGYPDKDIKEFIKRLKETLKVHERVNSLIVKQIDKLAGEKFAQT